MCRAKFSISALAATASCVALAACGGKRVLVPPRLDLHRYERVGLVRFTMRNAKGSLNQMATQRFADEIFADQTGVEVLELGDADSVLQRLGATDFTPEAVQKLKAEYDVPVVFVGELDVSKVKPSGGLLGVSFPHLEATVDADLTVRLLSTESGGTVWRASASAAEKVGEVGLAGGVPYFSAEHPDDAYGRLVERLVYGVSYDLRPTWRKR